MYQLQLGVGHDIFQHPEKHTYTDSSWVQELVNAMRKYNIKLMRNNTQIPPIYRKNDQKLMDVINKKDMSETERRHVNQCRLYLKIINISDMTHACRTKINTDYYRQPVHKSKLFWPQIPSPPEKVWKTWNTMIKKYLCKNKRDNDLQQQFLLGK